MEDSEYFVYVAECSRMLHTCTNKHPRDMSLMEAFHYLRGRSGFSDDLLVKIIEELYFPIYEPKLRWYNSCPEWFKPLRDMGIAAGQWEDGKHELLCNLFNHDTPNPQEFDIETVKLLTIIQSQEDWSAICRLRDMSDELSVWVISQPR